MVKRMQVPCLHLLIIALVLILAFPIQAQAAEILSKEKLTIQQALDIAYQNNPDFRTASLQVDKSQIQRDDAAREVSWVPIAGLVSSTYKSVFNQYEQAEISLKTAQKNKTAAMDSVTKKVVSAYTDVLSSANTIEKLRLNGESMRNQLRIAGIARTVGTVSDVDYTKLAQKLLENKSSINAAQASYQSAVAQLGILLDKGQSWEPELTSRVLTNEYPRLDLSTEISRGTSESILVWTAKASVDSLKSQDKWTTIESTDITEINSSLADINYEQAKTQVRAQIEALYYSIDALEDQIAVAESSYKTTDQDLKLATLKHDLGLISEYSLTSGAESLSSARINAESERLSLEKLRADLVNAKANFAYLTGQQVYAVNDWSL